MSLKVLRVFNCCKYLSYGSLGCSTYSTKCISWSSNYAAGRKVSCVTFTTSVVNFTSRDAPFDDEKPKENKVKKPPVPKVTLLGPDNTIVTVATLEEIQKISTKKDLRLVKIVDLDAKSHRPIYKMMTEAQYMEEDFQIKKQKKEKKSKHVIKGEKLVLISERISDNDLEQRIKKMIKWLSTKHEVRVIISCPGESKILAERAYKIIENAVKGGLGTIVQKRYKNIDLRFNILPPKVPTVTANSQDEKAVDVQQNEESGCSEKV